MPPEQFKFTTISIPGNNRCITVYVFLKVEARDEKWDCWGATRPSNPIFRAALPTLRKPDITVACLFEFKVRIIDVCGFAARIKNSVPVNFLVAL
jgi:hypothetical protein